MANKTPTHSTIDAYLAEQPPEARAMLEQLRGIIRSAVPEAIEGISYQMPVFRRHGVVAWIGGFKKHCSLFGIPAEIMDQYANELTGYRTAKGTIQFKFGEPVPAGLVKKLVGARARENEAAQSIKGKRNAKV